MKELDFLAGKFFTFELPREKQFLFKYFKTEIEQAFLRYYYCFGDFENFSDHTGHHCQLRWLRLLKKRLDKLLAAHAEAKASFDLERVALIESGKARLK